MKKLTIYCIKLDTSPNCFIGVADNSIPIRNIGSYFDVMNSFIFDSYIPVEELPFIENLCKDTKKTAILNLNHHQSIIKDFVDVIIGNEITSWENYTFNDWDSFVGELTRYTENNYCIVEIDHPINLNDEKLIPILKEGKESIEKIRKELEEIKKKYKEDKNGK